MRDVSYLAIIANILRFREEINLKVGSMKTKSEKWKWNKFKSIIHQNNNHNHNQKLYKRNKLKRLKKKNNYWNEYYNRNSL